MGMEVPFPRRNRAVPQKMLLTDWPTGRLRKVSGVGSGCSYHCRRPSPSLHLLLSFCLLSLPATCEPLSLNAPFLPLPIFERTSEAAGRPDSVQFLSVAFLFFQDHTHPAPPQTPRILRASWMSFCMIVTRLAWMAQRLVSSKRWTRNASAASCRARIAWDCHRSSSAVG